MALLDREPSMKLEDVEDEVKKESEAGDITEQADDKSCKEEEKREKENLETEIQKEEEKETETQKVDTIEERVLTCTDRVEDADPVFAVMPNSNLLPAGSVRSFTITFAPPMVNYFKSETIASEFYKTLIECFSSYF